MDSQQHSHTPWLVILYKFLAQWRQANGGRFPATYAERQAVRGLIKSGERGTAAQPDHGDEENWRQAQAAVTTALLPAAGGIPAPLAELLQRARAHRTVGDKTPAAHWLLCRALAAFHERHGCLPLCGALPDMVSDSERYVQLLGIYRRAAERDAAEFGQLLRAECAAAGRSADDCVPAGQVALFCKNARHLRLVGTPSYRQQSRPQPQTVARCLEESAETGSAPFWWYLVFRGCDRFHAEFGRWPGSDDASFPSDVGPLKARCAQLVQDWLSPLAPPPAGLPEDLLHEVCRFGRAEVHAVAAWMGGVLAQEGIKLLTGQFVPETRVMLYDAIGQTCSPVF